MTALSDALQRPAQSNVPLWVDAWDYGKQVMINGRPAPWQDVGALVAHHRQLQGLVGSDVITVDVGDFYNTWLDDHPALLDALGEKRRLGYALRTLLADPAPRAVLLEVVQALSESYPDKPLLLALPAPRSWMARVYCRAKQLECIDISWDDAESASMYMADFLRVFAPCELSGVLLRDSTADGPARSEDLERYRPVLNIAAHYRWQVALAGCADQFQPSREQTIDAMIRSHPAAGGGMELPAQVWSGADIPSIGETAFWHVTVPDDAVPERVLELLATLRTNRGG